MSVIWTARRFAWTATLTALAYVRYSLTGAGIWLAVSVAFVVLGANQLVFGLTVSPDALGDKLAVYFWPTR